MEVLNNYPNMHGEDVALDPMLFTTTSCTPHLYHPQQEENTFGVKIASVVFGVDAELSLGHPGRLWSAAEVVFGA